MVLAHFCVAGTTFESKEEVLADLRCYSGVSVADAEKAEEELAFLAAAAQTSTTKPESSL